MRTMTKTTRITVKMGMTITGLAMATALALDKGIRMSKVLTSISKASSTIQAGGTTMMICGETRAELQSILFHIVKVMSLAN